MNCPQCGTETVQDQQFCRSCGTGLTDAASRVVRPQVLGMLVLMLVFGGLLTTMTGKIFDLKWVMFTGVFIMVGGMFFAAAFALLHQFRPRKRGPLRSPMPQTLSAADTTNKLPPINESDLITSVTESTTDLLKVPVTNQAGGRD